jgi:hypothetical protein
VPDDDSFHFIARCFIVQRCKCDVLRLFFLVTIITPIYFIPHHPQSHQSSICQYLEMIVIPAPYTQQEMDIHGYENKD